MSVRNKHKKVHLASACLGLMSHHFSIFKLQYLVWFMITDEGSVPEMSIYMFHIINLIRVKMVYTS